MGAPELLHAEIIKVDLNGATIRVSYASDTENIALQGEGGGLSWLPPRGLKPENVKEENGRFTVRFLIQLMGQESCEFRARSWDQQGTQYWETTNRHHLVYDENKRVVLDGNIIRWGKASVDEEDSRDEEIKEEEEEKKDVVALLSQKLREKEKALEKRSETSDVKAEVMKEEPEDLNSYVKDLIEEWKYEPVPPLNEDEDHSTLKLMYWLFMTLLSDKGNFEFNKKNVKEATIALHDRIPRLGSKALYEVVMTLSPVLYEVLYLGFVEKNIGEDQARERLENLLPLVEDGYKAFQDLRLIEVQYKTGEMRKDREFEFQHFLFKYF